MKNILLNSLLVSTIFFTTTTIADAQLYKGLDAEGNVVYSDQPFENAEKFTPASLSVVNTPKRAPKPSKSTTDEEEVKAFKYTDFDIVSPKNNETIWDNPQLAVTLRLKPDLNTKEKHTVWLLMDGKVIVKNSQTTTLQIGRLERGAHQLQAQVRDKAGKVVIRSRPIVVHIKNTTVRPRKAPR
ncbi:MAG: DUF4124 domain-containing protein [Gammaproteobacteria bacterium]|nr:DUF4124 domain-containing protein [Gammaproteobacteria bacterium]